MQNLRLNYEYDGYFSMGEEESNNFTYYLLKEISGHLRYYKVMSADNFNLEKFKLFQDKKVDVVTKCVLGTLTDEDLLELKSLIDFWPETKFDFSELANYDSSSYRYVKFRYKSSASLFQSVNPTIEINNILYKTETEWVDNRTDSHYIIKLCPM